MEFSPYGEYPPHGYMQQLARAHRFFDRYQRAARSQRGMPQNDFTDIEDFLWAFFQNCWHVKDWLRHDPSVPEGQKLAVLGEAERLTDLLVAADLANGSKHLSLRNERVGAYEGAIQFHDEPDGSVRLEHLVRLRDASEITASEAGLRALNGWRQLFKVEGMPHFQERL